MRIADAGIQRMLLLPAILTLICLVAGCNKKPQEMNGTKAVEIIKTKEGASISDASLPDFQIQLLELAFETASLIPVNPFIKDRSLAQEKVVDACLKLDLPVRAVRYSDKIDNWRRGLCYANTAKYLVQNGHTADQVRKGLEIAEQIADMDHGQQWRNDRIKAAIAQTYMLLGQPENAQRFNRHLTDAAEGTTEEQEVLPRDTLSFEEKVSGLDSTIALMNFDLTQAALQAYAELFNAYYTDVEKRNITQTKINEACEKHKIPLPIRMELLIILASIALEHNDQAKTMELVNEAQILLDDYEWPLEKRIPLSANVSELRYKAGGPEQALADLGNALLLYDEHSEEIVDIYQAETIRPIAEAYQCIGDKDKALAVYKKTVEAGMANLNLKPRAEALSSTCGSMALNAVEPDQELVARMNSIKDELGQL